MATFDFNATEVTFLSAKAHVTNMEINLGDQFEAMMMSLG